MMASVALVMAMGALGHVDDLADVAERAVERAITAFESSPMRFWFGAVYARACRLTGHIDECGQSARRIADSARDVPGFAYANLAFLLGHASLVRGDLRSALSLLREARAGVEKHGATTGLRPASCFGLAEAHAKLGQVAAAEEALAEAQRFVPAEYLFMQTALSLATGWTLAAKGYLGEAIATAHQAATEARERGQPTHELACLQAAAQWGDASQASRARDLADELSLPLANTVARHAESLLSGDGKVCLRPRRNTRRSVTGSRLRMPRHRQRPCLPAANTASGDCMRRRQRGSLPPSARGCARRHCAPPPDFRWVGDSVRSSS
ncbi:transcriptional regulator, LuxR family domain protein [Mycobacterium xenopi 4042]|uniref:Transcriptional regulator, LuxR family domain protein n=1 Tax=Mycobacterium xenopi 4042 TaxID=1299334 RepID=X8BEB5_MYCXE|nr:transcriptional regulator, LuxR family domain protein [Mycobacterium xenopi 4042]